MGFRNVAVVSSNGCFVNFALDLILVYYLNDNKHFEPRACLSPRRRIHNKQIRLFALNESQNPIRRRHRVL
jgi:hypothetical protein